MPEKEDQPKGWYLGKSLPHFDGGSIVQFLTWRLADSLPSEVLERIAEEIRDLSPEERQLEKLKRQEEYLDNGSGSCILSDPKIAKLVQDSLLFGNGKSYDLYSWVIMPNHVHVLLSPLQGKSIGRVVHSIKSYTSHQIGILTGSPGVIWQRDYFDRFIRSGEHLRYVVSYIENNPVKAGLCRSPLEFPFSSAHPDFESREPWGDYRPPR